MLAMMENEMVESQPSWMWSAPNFNHFQGSKEFLL